MRVPDSEKKLIEFARETIELCTYSQASRSQEYASNLSYYERGTDTEKDSLYNRTGVHIDRTASYLYAPGEVRYTIGFDATEGDTWLARAKAASKYLSREYRRADADILFAQGVLVSLLSGCSIVKHNWMSDESLSEGFNPILVPPEFFGVEREDLERLEDQQAMVHTTYLSKDQLKQLISGKHDEAEIMKNLKKIGGTTGDESQRQNWLHQVVIGGINPVPIGTPDGTRGQVSMSPSSKTEFHPNMMNELMRMDELWVVDNEREDYTVIQLIEGVVLLEGKYRHRNLTGVKGLLPFSKVCADPVPGYFYGRSEVSRVKTLQDMLTERMGDVRKILRLQVDEPMAFIGFAGLTTQKRRALMSPKGWIQEQTPGAKIERLGPKMPEDVFKEVNLIVEMFDEIGGFKPILQGQGESGVRANAHARTLMRTASPKLRERALRVERNAESSAHIAFQLMQAKEPRVFKSEAGEEFLLKQLPDDLYVEIDSHSSSTAFVDDAREMAAFLNKVGAAGPSEVVLLTNPPQQDQLLAAIKKREMARAKFMQEHPEAAGGKKPKA